jgi:hypothetical protein
MEDSVTTDLDVLDRRQILRIAWSSVAVHVAFARGRTTVLARASQPAAAMRRDQEESLEAIEELRAALSSMDTTWNPTSDNPAARDLRWLADSARRMGGPPIPDEAISSLRGLAYAYQSSPPTVARELRTKILEDLSIKARYCRADPAGMAALVRLTVRTYRQQPQERAEDPNWQVMYLSAPLLPFPNQRPGSFPAFSSPTTTSLPPGIWAVWAQDPNNAARRGPVRELRLGEKPGQAELVADLVIP